MKNVVQLTPHQKYSEYVLVYYYNKLLLQFMIDYLLLNGM